MQEEYDRETGVTPVLSAQIPDITGDNLDFNSSFSGINYIDITRKTYKIFYIIKKDSWDNPVESPAYRVVHIYESQQFLTMPFMLHQLSMELNFPVTMMLMDK